MDGDSSDGSFKVLSLQGLSAFFMMFGLVGLGMQRELMLSSASSTLSAVAAGFVSVWILSKVFRGLMKMQTSGTIDIQIAVPQYLKA